MEIAMGTGGMTSSIWISVPMILLYAAAACALLFGFWSWARAWRISSRHEPFRALGFRRWIMGYAAVAYMPDSALAHVKRYCISIVAFIACLLAIIAIVWFDAAR